MKAGEIMYRRRLEDRQRQQAQQQAQAQQQQNQEIANLYNTDPQAAYQTALRYGRNDLMQEIRQQQQNQQQARQARSAPHASAKTRLFNNGTVQQVLSDGSINVIAPNGQVITDPEQMQAAIQAGVQSGIDEQQDRAAARTTGTQTSGRRQGFISTGIEAADALYGLQKSRKLLELVKTGGIDRARLAAKQALGIESANEAELTYQLGVNVLKQLKPIFGAQFTAKEGEELKKLEAGLGKSVAGNKRIIEQLYKKSRKAVRRAMHAAKQENGVNSFEYEEMARILKQIDEADVNNLFGPANAELGIKPNQTRQSANPYDTF